MSTTKSLAAVKRPPQQDWATTVMEACVAAGLPFTILSCPQVQRMLDEYQHGKSSPSPTTIRRRLFDKEAMVRQDLKAMLASHDGKVAIAVDSWTSRNRQAYLAIKGYWIDQDWKYHEHLLGFPSLSGEHTGHSLAKQVMAVLQYYRIETRISTITTDNATNNKTVFEGIEQLTQEIETDLLSVPEHEVNTDSKDDEPPVSGNNRRSHQKPQRAPERPSQIESCSQESEDPLNQPWEYIKEPTDSTATETQYLQEDLSNLFEHPPDQEDALQIREDIKSTNTGLQMIPCLVHVIQLALKEVLRTVNVVPKASEPDKVPEDHDALSGGRERDDEDLHSTLHKVRKLAVWVNHSPQRIEKFEIHQESAMKSGKQTAGPFLRLIQDVATRWDSTCHMLVRFSHLREAVTEYARADQDVPIKISITEWNQIGYLVDLTKPFARWTTLLSKSREATAQLVILAYHTLFATIDQKIDLLKDKQEKWKKDLLRGLKNAREKLLKYYERVNKPIGNLFGPAILLTPNLKDRFVDEYPLPPSLAANTTTLQMRDAFWDQLEHIFHRDYANSEAVELSQGSQPTTNSVSSLFKPKPKGSQGAGGAIDDELKRYKDRPTTGLSEKHAAVNALHAWREIEREFPCVARMARDILCTPGATSSVESVFSTARHHYRFNNTYKKQTFSALMVLRHKCQQENRGGLAIGVEEEVTTGADLEHEERLQETHVDEDDSGYISYSARQCKRPNDPSLTMETSRNSPSQSSMSKRPRNV